jgi:HAMP domain-containing protein
MAKLTSKIAVPIILVGIFAIVVFIAINYEQLGADFYITVLCLAVFVFSFGFAIGQSIASPVRKLLEEATELSKGNLSSRTYLESKDELSELAEVFNKIAEELKVSREQETNIEKSVGIKVKARTKDLEETIGALEQKVKNRTIELERLIEESNKLQIGAKTKETEIAQLKKELSNFKQKLGRYSKPKQGIVNDNI